MADPRDESTDRIADGLLAYLKDELNDSSITLDGPLAQLHGGFDATIYRFQFAGSQKELNRPLVLRLYPEWRGPEDAVGEYAVQNAMANGGLPVPRAHFICKDKSILGGVFFIMDFSPGETLITAPVESLPDILGKTHARLHDVNPTFMVESLQELGVADNEYRLQVRLDYLQRYANEFPEIREAVDWLIQNRPPEPERLAICHSDFHPMNILQQDGKVTSILDWSDFLIADPALDIANTIRLLTIAFKHIAPTGFWGEELASVDWESASQRYLQSYQAHLPLDNTNLDYYGVMANIFGIIPDLRGSRSAPPVEVDEDLIESYTKDLNDFIYRVTGIQATQI